MSDYDTMNFGDAETTDIWELLTRLQSTIILIVLVITLASLVYGATSWCVIKKFRSYKNFVFLNTILSNFLSCLLATIIENLPIEVKSGLFRNSYFMFLTTYFPTARLYWLLVLSHMFYVDLVKVFNGNIKRGYLKSCLFAWGVSLINTGILMYAHLYTSFRVYEYALYEFIMLPLIISCILYITFVYSLFRSFRMSTKTVCSNWRRFYIATFIFVLCDMSLVSNYVVIIVPYNLTHKVLILNICYYCLTNLVLDVLLVVLKTNRELWHEYYANKLNQKSSEKQNLDIVKPELSV